MFLDRSDAGRRLAQAVEGAGIRGREVVVLGLPRGGVPVAFEVAHALGVPLDVIVVRKLGVPFQPELAMGAIGEGGVRVLNADVIGPAVDAVDIDAIERRERAELDRRARLYRGDRPRLDLHGRCAVIVDDGVATGSTARAACLVAHALGAARVVLAVPVASRSAVAALRDACDEMLCVEAPESFYAVGEWYRDFSQTTDAQVVELLRRAAEAERDGKVSGQFDYRVRDEEVQVPSGDVILAGTLTVPDISMGTVVFAHGSGSSRHSPRNRYVARVLSQAGLATLLMDLLTVGEEGDRSRVFDVPMLADRLGDAVRWTWAQPVVGSTTVGLFGASTGAAAALRAAAQPDCAISAVVCRGGRPDLAAPLLPAVSAPTLLIVGGCDDAVLALNRRAQADLQCENRLAVVPGATHLFEEAGALESVARLARDWFVEKLGSPSAGGDSLSGR